MRVYESPRVLLDPHFSFPLLYNGLYVLDEFLLLRGGKSRNPAATKAATDQTFHRPRNFIPEGLLFRFPEILGVGRRLKDLAPKAGAPMWEPFCVAALNAFPNFVEPFSGVSKTHSGYWS